MITEYQTCIFNDPESDKKQNMIDRLVQVASRDIRAANNKLCKVQKEVLYLSNPSMSREKAPEEGQLIELLSTIYGAGLIRELEDVAMRVKHLLREFKKYQLKRLANLDEIFENLDTQIEQAFKERSQSNNERTKQLASLAYEGDQQKLQELKRELIRMKRSVFQVLEEEAA